MAAFALHEAIVNREDITVIASYSKPCFNFFCSHSHGVQKGKDEEGLNGFLAEDIRKEVKRGEAIKCDFCGKGGATIPCHRYTLTLTLV